MEIPYVDIGTAVPHLNLGHILVVLEEVSANLLRVRDDTGRSRLPQPMHARARALGAARLRRRRGEAEHI